MRALFWRWMGFGDVVIRVYYAFHYNHQVYFRGRVLRDDFVKAHSGDHWYRNIINMLRRLLSYELPSAQILVEYTNDIHSLYLDKEGFFKGEIAAPNPIHEVIKFTIPHSELDRYHREDITQQIPLENLNVKKGYGIISDIDDTIMQTGVTSFFKWRLIFNTLFLNPGKRKTFTHTVDLFRKLNTNRNNPFFYISNSPWNMYDYLMDFLIGQEFPKGLLVLRDININQPKSSQIESQNKYKEVVSIYRTFKNHKFILIGDAGEYDAQIYLTVATKYPEQTKAIYIRSVNSKKKNKSVKSLIPADTKIPFILFDQADEILSHIKDMDVSNDIDNYS